MTNSHKAVLLLSRAARVLTSQESLILAAVRDGKIITEDEAYTFACLCERLRHYLK